MKIIFHDVPWATFGYVYTFFCYLCILYSSNVPLLHWQLHTDCRVAHADCAFLPSATVSELHPVCFFTGNLFCSVMSFVMLSLHKFGT